MGFGVNWGRRADKHFSFHLCDPEFLDNLSENPRFFNLVADYFDLLSKREKNHHDFSARDCRLEKQGKVQIGFQNAPQCHPTSFSVLDHLSPLVRRFGVNMKEGHRKERLTLNNGDSFELQRMLVLFSLFSI